MLDLKDNLPNILPKAIQWAEDRAREIEISGQQLSPQEKLIACSVGVRRTGLIRLQLIDRLPLPEDPELKEAALATGLLGLNIVGLTLGYGIYICEGHKSPRLLTHEFRHVYQYEQAGSIAQFLQSYLKQIVDYGYQNAPFEIDARQNENRQSL